MSDRIGKYYWIKTEAGKEIGFKRDSGAWEMHGIDCTEDLRSEVLEVYEEVANEDIKQPEKALAIQRVSLQRELLINFLNWHESENLGCLPDGVDGRIDEYLKLINRG